MRVEIDREKMIFRNDKGEKPFYTMGISRKNQDGTYTSGYIQVKFPKAADISNNTKIKIHEAWLDFYIVEKEYKITKPYIFINKYEIIEDVKIPTNIKTEYDDTNISLADDELPF